MPIYMDLHIVPGVTAKDVAEAHKLDVYLEKDHSCKCMTYWVDELRGHVFCLIDAPSKEKVTELHNKAHGLTPHKIIEVQPNLVESFLGRISDPEETELTDTGLKLINETSFRIILATKMKDPKLLQYQLGMEKATTLIRELNTIIREEISHHNGIEAEHAGSDFIASFTSAAKAISCSGSIHQKINDADLQQAGLRMSIHAGEPVSKNEQLFGETIQLAERLCFIGKPALVSITSTVKELVAKDLLPVNENNLYTLSGNDQNLLNLLFTALDENFQDPDFNMDEYGNSVAMSKSQLYRKTMALCELSPNTLLKEYRLEKARELMKKKNQNITEITFNSGFNSPSYFTKCFKKKYGLLPMAYLDLMQ
ncbi:nickel-binding protein [Lacibacter sp. H407]|uniref:nickel-binding protein n=1 Tax=Lacibacter sp. H407 TaxID=3133423 RepID=UPI0030C32B8E